MVSIDVPEPQVVVVADGTRIASYVWEPEGGDGDAPVVVAVHGFASSAAANFAQTGWTRDLPRAGFRVIALDQRGHGASDTPHDPARYDLDVLVDDVVAVLDHHGVDAAHYVGYSLGARVGWRAALRAPERVLSAVLGGVPDGEPLERFDLAQARAHVEDGAEVTDRITAAYLTMADSVAGNDVRALIALVEGMRGSGSLDPEDPPHQPVLVATGSEDGILERSRRLAAALPQGSFVEIPGRHHFNAPTSRHFRTAAVDFLTDVPAAAPPAEPVPLELARSWLLVPALGDVDAASRSGCDALVLDLEDAVDGTRKDEARDAAVAWLQGGGRAWVRVNGRASEHWSRDVDALRGLPGLVGVVLSKTEQGTQVTETADRLGGEVPVVALVESALGVEAAVEVARARGCVRLAFGSQDYRLDTATADTEVAMGYPRSRLVVASRIGGLPAPVDGPTTGGGRAELRRACEAATDLGLTGKLCLAPEEAGVVAEALSPARTDVAWAREVLADFAARGRVVRDSSDLPRVGRAERLDRLARAYGV
ncbi:alpha/beta fold hydrolase, partial [Pseudokineococcus marinus]